MSKRTEISMHVTTDNRSHKVQRRERIGKNDFEPLHRRCCKRGPKKPRTKNHRRTA